MSERQREVIAKATSERKYKGRQATPYAKTDIVKLTFVQGVSKAQVCTDLDISRLGLYRIIGELKKQETICERFGYLAVQPPVWQF